MVSVEEESEMTTTGGSELPAVASVAEGGVGSGVGEGFEFWSESKVKLTF